VCAAAQAGLSLGRTPQLLALTAPNVQAYFNKYGASFTFTSTLSKTTDPTTEDPSWHHPRTQRAFCWLFLMDTSLRQSELQRSPGCGAGSPQNTHQYFGRLTTSISNNTQAYFRVTGRMK